MYMCVYIYVCIYMCICVYVLYMYIPGRIFRFCSGGVPKFGGGVPTPPYFFYFELSETRLSAFSAFEVSFASRFTVLLLIQQNEANHYISC